MIDLSLKKYFLFDMDGTLLDLEQLNFQCFAEQVRAATRNTLSFDDYMKHFAGVGSSRGFENYLKSVGASELEVAPLVLAYRERKKYFLDNKFDEMVKVKDGVVEFLTKLSLLGRKLAVGTSTAKKFALFNLEKAHIKDFFDVIVTVDDVTQTKPAPDIFFEALRQLGGNKREAVIFEDSANGVKSAVNTGIDFYVLRNPGKNNAVVAAHTNVITSYKELLGRLGGQLS